jgi:hypothetical protein
MESIDWLKEDLWRRWRDRMERSAMAETPANATRVVYGRGPLYDLKSYTPRRFEPGGRSSEQPFLRDDNWIYRLDDAGRPVQMNTRHSYNRVDWHGTYEYSADGAEYVEWCVQTGVCSQYARVTIREGVPAAFQRLAINARGSFPVWQGVARPTLIELIASDRKNYQIALERYDVRDGRIEGGETYTEGLGAPPMRATLHYTYTGDKLDRIVQRSASLGDQTVFAAPQATSLEQLSADLARRIAEATVEAMRGRKKEFPLAALELSYRAVQSYVPVIIPCSERDALLELCLCTAIDVRRWVELRDADFSPAMADFQERLRSSEEYDAGTQMLRDAARQVAELAPRQLPVTPHFVAYAIDWELEGDQLATILRECGASADALREFQSRGWI